MGVLFKMYVDANDCFLDGIPSAIDNHDQRKKQAQRVQADRSTEVDDFLDKYENRQIIDEHIIHTPVTTLQMLVENLRAHLDDLEGLSQQHPKMSSADMLQPVATETARAIRKKVWEIFSESAAFIGRNSVEAIRADTRFSVKRGFDAPESPVFVATKGSRFSSDPIKYIDDVVSMWLDPDQHPHKFDVSIYNYLKDNSTPHPFYNSLYNRLNRKIKK